MSRNSNLDSKSSGAGDPARGVVAINIGGGDQTLAVDGRFLFITTAGNINVVCADGSTAILPVTIGVLNLQVRTIKQASTTAAGWVFV